MMAAVRGAVSRRSDMEPGMVLRLRQQEDGDIIVSIGPAGHRFHEAAVEFCAGTGGGASPLTKAALGTLLAAMHADELARPQVALTPRAEGPSSAETGAVEAGQKLLNALRRCEECWDDGADTDVGRPMLHALTAVGWIESHGRSRCWIATQAGLDVLALPRPAPEVAPDAEGVQMPPEPTAEMLNCIAFDVYPDDKNEGHDGQRRLGTDVVWPKYEIEAAYGQYQRLRRLIGETSTPPAASDEPGSAA